MATMAGGSACHAKFQPSIQAGNYEIFLDENGAM